MEEKEKEKIRISNTKTRRGATLLGFWTVGGEPTKKR
jgi:hypothetical protein